MLHPSELPGLPAWYPVAVDTETDGLWADSGARLSVVSVAWIDPEVLSDPDPDRLRHAVKTGEGVRSAAFPFAQGIYDANGNVKPGRAETLFGDDPNLGRDEYDALIAWLRQHQHLYHNAKFDLEKLRHAPIGADASWHPHDFLEQVHWDSQVVNPLFWPREVTGLKPTAGRLWGVDETAEAEALKPYLGPKDDPRFDLVPWSVLGPYAAKDAELTVRLAYHQWALLGEWGYWRPEGIDFERRAACLRELEVMRILYRMERSGVPYAAAESMKAAATLESRRLYLETQLPFRPTPKQASRFFFEEGQIKTPRGGLVNCLGLEPYSVTDLGNPQFNAEVVGRLIRDYQADTVPGRVARTWEELAKLATANKMWYLPYAQGLGSDGRLRTCFRQVTRGRGTEDGGTRSGRFSVERVNLQAIPHDYRLVAGPERSWAVPTPRQLIGLAAGRLDGWELWEFDLAQAELRVAAAWSKCYRMLDAMKHGRDLHGETTSELFHVDTSDPRWGQLRQIGKRANFSLCFGAGGETFAKMVSKETGVPMPVDEASHLVRRWNEIYPEYQAAIDRWQSVVDAQGHLVLASRRGFASGRLRTFARDEDTHKAFNQLVQGSLAEFLKDWLIEVQRRLDAVGLGFVPGVGWTGLLLTIHDSLVVLLPAGEQGDEIAQLVTGAARGRWQEFFNTGDPAHRVETVDGFAEGKRWG